MILKHQKLDLFGHMLFETAIAKPPLRMPNDMSNEACFLYVLEGSCNIESERGSASVKKRDSMLMKCGNFLHRMHPDEETQHYRAVVVHFHPEVLQKVYDGKMPSILSKPQPLAEHERLAPIKKDQLFGRYMESLLFYFENPELVNDELLMLKVKELILLLANTKNVPMVQRILSNLFNKQTVRFQEVINSHLYAEVTLDDLAFLTGLSLSSFKREFKRIYGESPGGYLKNQKLIKAEQMLKASPENISSIAYDCGFNDVSHFSRSFRERFGMSPKEMRKQHQEGS